MLKFHGAVVCLGLIIVLFWGFNYKTTITKNADLLQSLKIQVEIAKDKIPPDNMIRNSWDYSNFDDERIELKKRKAAVEDLLYQNELLFHDTLIKIAMTTAFVIVFLTFVRFIPNINLIN